MDISILGINLIPNSPTLLQSLPGRDPQHPSAWVQYLGASAPIQTLG